MSVFRFTEVVCDGPNCDNARAEVGAASNVRSDARQYEGWLTALPGGKDFCSEACRVAATEEESDG